MALVAGLTVLDDWKGDVDWHTDSQATIDIWRRIDQKTGKQWHNVDNKDVWRTLRRLKARWKGRLRLLKVKAHQDRRKSDSCMTMHEVQNMVVDKLADRAYNLQEVLPAGALDEPEGVYIAIHGRECVGKTRAALRNHIAIQRIRRWMLQEQENRRDEDLMWGETSEMDWDMMLESGKVGSVQQRRHRMRVMFNTLATNDWVQSVCDEDHDKRCACGAVETQEHIIMECTLPDMVRVRNVVCKDLRELVYGTEEQPKVPTTIMAKVIQSLGLGPDRKAMEDYNTVEEMPAWAKHGPGLRWLSNGTYPVWLGFVNKAWRETHQRKARRGGGVVENVSELVNITRKMRVIMVEGCWELWKARCDRVHRAENEDTVNGREKTYNQLKHFWVQHVGCKRVGRSIIEVLHMSHEDREKWKRSIKGKEYTPTRMDEYYTVEDNESQPPEARAELVVVAPEVPPRVQGLMTAFLVRGATQVEEQASLSLSDSSSDDDPGGEVYLDDDTPLDMAIEMAKHAFSRARTHAMRAILSARRLVQRIKKEGRNTVQVPASHTDSNGYPAHPSGRHWHIAGAGSTQAHTTRRKGHNEKTHERHGSGVGDCATRGTAGAPQNMALGHQIRSVSGSPCDSAGIRTVQEELPSARSRTGDKSNRGRGRGRKTQVEIVGSSR
jgi:hypothetical protein